MRAADAPIAGELAWPAAVASRASSARCHPTHFASPLHLQLGSLASLQSLGLCNCTVSSGSLDQLASLPLRKLDIGYSTLPACLAQLTRLTCLVVSGYKSADLERLNTALVPLSGLRTLALSAGRYVWPLPTGVTALHSLSRFLLQRACEPNAPELPPPGGPWLASLQWLVSVVLGMAVLG